MKRKITMSNQKMMSIQERFEEFLSLLKQEKDSLESQMAEDSV